MKRKRAELCGTEMLDKPGGDEAQGPVFIHYITQEKERKICAAERFENVRRRLEIARLKREDTKAERLEERMTKLKWLLKAYEEEEAHVGPVQDSLSGEDLPSEGVEDGKQKTMEGTLLFRHL